MFIGTYTEKEGLMFLALNFSCPGDSIDQYNLLVICGIKMCETLALRVFIYSTRLQLQYRRAYIRDQETPWEEEGSNKAQPPPHLY